MAYYKCTGYDTSRVTAAAGDVLSGKTIVSSTGELINGNIAKNEGGTKYAATSSQKLAGAGTYLTGDLILAALTASNLSAANIKKGVTVSVNNGKTDLFTATGTFLSSPTLNRVQLGRGGNATPMFLQPEGGLLISSCQTQLSSNYSSGIRTFLDTYPSGYPPYNDSTIYSQYGVTQDQVLDFMSNMKSPIPRFSTTDSLSYLPLEYACTVLYDQIGSDWGYQNIVTWVWIGRMKQSAWAGFDNKTVNITFSP
ncbi:MAG: hypothetical protein K6G81_00165 [Lachnospiraceae bacterium]|nr:hypothetical protein [Lachnospiraceae bacterium]